MDDIVRTKPSAFLPTRWEQFLPPPPSARARKLLLPAQRKIIARTRGKLACQWDGAVPLSPADCLARQFCQDCLGCGARCHLCHVCRVKPLAFQDIELCRACLMTALAEEAARGMPPFNAALQIFCQRTRVRIECGDCAKLQLHQTKYEEECLFCTQPSYQCQRCRKFPSRYPNQGLCLHCMVEEYDGLAEDPKIEAFLARLRPTSPPSPVA